MRTKWLIQRYYDGRGWVTMQWVTGTQEHADASVRHWAKYGAARAVRAAEMEGI